jgi:hypothetical protein
MLFENNGTKVSHFQVFFTNFHWLLANAGTVPDLRTTQISVCEVVRKNKVCRLCTEHLYVRMAPVIQ